MKILQIVLKYIKRMNRINFKVKNFKPFNQPEPKVKKVKDNNEFNWEIKGSEPNERNVKITVDEKGLDDFHKAIKDWVQFDKYTDYGIGVIKEMKNTMKYDNINFGNQLIYGTSGEEKKEVIEKPKVTEKDITIRTISNEDRKYSEYGHVNHHSHKEYKLVEKYKSTSIKITDNVGGCGVQQLYNWYNSENNKNIELVLNKVLKDVEYGVGLIMCQVGQDFFDSLFVKALVNSGFTYSSYINYQHGKEYEGRMYMLKIEK